MRGCEIQREAKEGLEIVHLGGSMDAYSFPRLEEILNQMREQNRNWVILECSDLDYISSAALGALIGLSQDYEYHRVARISQDS